MPAHHGCPACRESYGHASYPEDAEQVDASLFERPTAESQDTSAPTIYNPYYTGRPRTPASGSRTTTLDRQEIIRRIKSNGSRPASPELERPSSRDYSCPPKGKGLKSRPPSPESETSVSSDVGRKRKSPVPPYLPMTQSSDQDSTASEVLQDHQATGLQIERPRSALHRGDFREKDQQQSSFERFGPRTPVKEEQPAPLLSTSPVVLWHAEFPPTAYRQTYEEPRTSLPKQALSIPRPARSRATSIASLASSFVYKPPTSPLVQSSRPDTPEPALRSQERSKSPEKSRRHTFSPQSFHRFQTAGGAFSQRPEKPLAYQAHQPRLSMNNTSPLPQAPLMGPRRPSLSDSPLHHAPLVGSYEESILRGRMSTTPSKPLSFLAQIGVLGRGDCKPSLRCPPHVQIPFPAVFYSYGSGTKTVDASDQPSPYVGLVDLENNLPHAEATRQDRRRRRLHDALNNEGSRGSSPSPGEAEGAGGTGRRRQQKLKRSSGSPKAPAGGSYRIPQQGQLQIVLKNPNKTAVKLFLVPYDLSDMGPGQKTFIRQRSYSAGPIIDMPLTSRRNLGTDRPEASINATNDPNDRPTLRYLIHLHICCPFKERYFLYKSIRVVFANRVPDGKEKLRNEIQMPEPRYSAYKPGRDSTVGVAGSSAKDFVRRRSAMVGLADDEARWSRGLSLAHSVPAGERSARPQQDHAIDSLPHHFTGLPIVESRPGSRAFSDIMDVDSNSQDTPSVRSPMSPISPHGDAPTRIVPLFEDAFRFERDRHDERRSPGPHESLLSQRLMNLAMGRQAEAAEESEFMPIGVGTASRVRTFSKMKSI